MPAVRSGLDLPSRGKDGLPRESDGESVCMSTPAVEGPDMAAERGGGGRPPPLARVGYTVRQASPKVMHSPEERGLRATERGGGLQSAINEVVGQGCIQSKPHLHEGRLCSCRRSPRFPSPPCPDSGPYP